MRRHAAVAALLLIGVGVVLGATVFRTDIAQATGLAQSVTVNNTADNPVPVREQNTDSKVGGAIKVHEEGVVRDDHVNVSFEGDANSGQQLNCGNNNIYTVPEGKQFVAEYVSIGIDTGQTTTLDTANLFGSNGVFAFVQLTNATLSRWVGSETINLVFPSGTTIGFNTQPDTADSPCGGGATVGGYLEPAP